jgi:hypothetical protein
VATSAQTCSGTGATWTCSYTIQGTDSGAITIADNALTGTLNDAAGNTAILTHGAVTTPSITADTVAPTIMGIALDNPNSCGGDGICVTGDTLRYIVTFGEPVTLTGTGTLTVPLTLTGGAATAVYTNTTPTTTSTVTVSRTILAGDIHTTGNITLATPLTLASLTVADAAGNAATLTHTSTSLGGIVINTSPTPTNTVAPTVTGTAGATGPSYVSNVLTCNNGTWTGSPTSYAYTWLSGGTPIAGATAQTYAVTSTTEGTAFTCTVAATNPTGTSAAVTSSNTIENWLPTDMSNAGTNLSAWYDASDNTKITVSGSNVSQWTDKSGQSRDMTTSANYPQFSSENEKPTVYFRGQGPSANNSFADVLRLSSQLNIATAYVIVKRVAPSAVGSYNFIFADSSTVDWHPNNGAGIGYSGASGASSNWRNGQNFNNGSAINILSQEFYNQWSLFSFITNSSGTMRVSNIGRDRTFWPSAGYYAEVIWLSSRSSTSEREKFEGYLAHKWGMTANLPIAHPFKTNPPTVP